MPKKLVIHGSFRYTDSNGQKRRAFRGDTINVSRKDAERGDRAGAFGTPADLVMPGLDESVVELAAQPPNTTPAVPMVSNAALLEAALRERLGVEAGASQGDVLRALDTALTAASTPVDSGTAPAPAQPAEPGGSIPPAPAGPDAVPAQLSGGGELVVEPTADDQGEPVTDAIGDEGLDDDADTELVDDVETEAGDQADRVPRPPLAAKVDKWREYAVDQGMPKADAAKASKADLIAAYGPES